MEKFNVTVWKTETYSTVIEVEAESEDAAMMAAEWQTEDDQSVEWIHYDTTIEATNAVEKDEENT